MDLEMPFGADLGHSLKSGADFDLMLGCMGDQEEIPAFELSHDTTDLAPVPATNEQADIRQDRIFERLKLMNLNEKN